MRNEAMEIEARSAELHGEVLAAQASQASGQARWYETRGRRREMEQERERAVRLFERAQAKFAQAVALRS